MIRLKLELTYIDSVCLKIKMFSFKIILLGENLSIMAYMYVKCGMVLELFNDNSLYF